MAEFLEGLKSAFDGVIARRRNKPFLEAAMAVCALVATADEEVSFSERTRLDSILETLDELKVYKVHEAINLFNELVERLQTEPEEAREEAFEAIERMRGKREDSQVLIRIALAVADAEGVILESERNLTVEICEALGRDPSEFGIARI